MSIEKPPSRRPPSLHLVGMESGVRVVEKDAMQIGLFPRSDPRVLSFFHEGFFSSVSLLDVVEQMRPGFVLDARRVPSFRTLNTDRREAFFRFSQIGTEYLDIAGAIGSQVFGVIRLDADAFVRALADFVSTIPSGYPVMFIFDDAPVMDVAARGIALRLRETTKSDIRSEVFVGGREWVSG